MSVTGAPVRLRSGKIVRDSRERDCVTQHPPDHPDQPDPTGDRVKKPRHKKHQNQSYGERLAEDASYDAPRADPKPVKGSPPEEPTPPRGPPSPGRATAPRSPAPTVASGTANPHGTTVRAPSAATGHTSATTA